MCVRLIVCAMSARSATNGLQEQSRTMLQQKHDLICRSVQRWFLSKFTAAEVQTYQR